MQIVRLSKNKPNTKIISTAVKMLKQGGVLVYPTETAYALGCDWTNERAKNKIYKIKGRRTSKKLPVIVADFKMAKKYGKFNAISEVLAKKYWPGPLTLVLKIKRSEINPPRFARFDELARRAERGRVDRRSADLAMRISSHKIARSLAKRLGKPIVATSANISGQGHCYSVKEVLVQFKANKVKPDLILDVGRLKNIKPSTIVRVVGNQVKVLRQGPVVVIISKS
jgi:L-threonylcarbamoyladenylate synthase